MAEPLKNLYNSQFLDELATAIGYEYEDFNSSLFFTLIENADWNGLELMQRVISW